MVIWTRLARAVNEFTPVAAGPVAVEWVLATDPTMTNILRQGVAMAQPEYGFSVHVDVQGLAPDRHYWYNFRVGGSASPIGRTRTLPAAETASSRFRFNVVSCQHWENGYFDAYDGMKDDDAAINKCRKRRLNMRFTEIANPEDQLALWKLISDKMWAAFALPVPQIANRQVPQSSTPQGRVASPAKPVIRAMPKTPHKSAVKAKVKAVKPKRAPMAPTPKPLPKPKPQPQQLTPTQAPKQQTQQHQQIAHPSSTPNGASY